MQTDISFLLELMLETKNMAEVRKKCKDRIREIEEAQQTRQQGIATGGGRGTPAPPHLAQAPSTLAALERQTGVGVPQVPIATTPLAQAALASRAATIAQATSGIEEKGRASPRKF